MIQNDLEMKCVCVNVSKINIKLINNNKIISEVIIVRPNPVHSVLFLARPTRPI